MDGVIDDVYDHRADVGVICLTDLTEKIICRLLDARELEFHELAAVCPCIYVRGGHPLAGRSSVTEEELDGYPYVAFEHDQGVASDFFEEYPMVSLKKPAKCISVNNRATAMYVLASTDAFTSGSGLLSEGLADGSVVTIPLLGKTSVHLGWIHIRSSRPSPLTEQFVRLLDEALDGIDESNSKRIDKYDIYYTGDMAKWRRLGNSLKLKFYMYLANKEDVGDEIKAIIDGGELMNSSADDFVFPFYTTPGNQNPNYQLTVQYPDYYEYCFFANPTVLDPMKALDDPRIPIYFRANADGKYISLEASEKGSVVTDKEISEKPSLCTEAVFQKNNLLRADYPDVICSYAETMFYVAEAYVRGLGVAKDLAQADAAYRKGIEASCVYNGVAAATAASFAAGVPSLSTLGGDDKALEAIASQQRIEMMMRPLEAWSNQRRTGYPALEVPASIRNFYPGIMHRWPYPEREGSVNDNVPHVDGVWTKMWFEN